MRLVCEQPDLLLHPVVSFLGRCGAHSFQFAPSVSLLLLGGGSGSWLHQETAELRVGQRQGEGVYLFLYHAHPPTVWGVLGLFLESVLSALLMVYLGALCL